MRRISILVLGVLVGLVVAACGQSAPVESSTDGTDSAEVMSSDSADDDESIPLTAVDSPSSTATAADEPADSTSTTTDGVEAPATDGAAATTSATTASSSAAASDDAPTTETPTTTVAPSSTSTSTTSTSTSTTSTSTSTTSTSTTTVAASDIRCLVYLHGKGGAGGSPSTNNGIVILSPNGNGTGWGGLQWEYDTNAQLQQATGSIVTSIDGANCGRVVIHGFSNGASMAAALQCSGNTLGGRLVGVVIDDPVTDSATSGCSPATGQVALYWTGALANAAPVGTQCAQIDWTCAGGEIRGIDAYAADLGVSATPSPHSDHQWNFATQLPFTWLG